MKEHIQLMATYNHWADKLLVQRIDLMDQAKLDQELKSSFPTVRLTMAHIFDAY